MKKNYIKNTIIVINSIIIFVCAILIAPYIWKYGKILTKTIMDYIFG